MVDFNLIAEMGIADTDVDALIRSQAGDALADGNMDDILAGEMQSFSRGKILSGRVVGKAGDDAIVDVGLKSEGLVNKSEFDNWDTLTAGDEVEVLLEDLDDGSGILKLSKRKADRIRGWERILETCAEGEVIEGRGMRKIKGGLLVDIGVPVFLPASQVDVRRPSDLSEFIGRTIRAEVIKIDRERRNIVISRRKVIERERNEVRSKLMEGLIEGSIIKGTVTNIADFGAFIDLGGIDGLLHITDMSWGRVNHPSELVKPGEEIEVKVLRIDREREKIALGLKQKDASPWEEVEANFPLNSRVKGKVVSLVSYGAFIELTEGVEGLVHVSEMSWTRRINHPSEMLEPGEEIEVVVLDINRDKHEISLGIKQTELNPWELVAEKFPPGTVIEGQVRNLTNYGAFIEIEPGIDGLLHVSDMSWTEKVAHANEKFKKGDTVECVVLDIDQDKQRVGLGVKQLTEDPWATAIPDAYKPGMVVHGTVTKLTNFGVFVELEDGLEGLLHISELSDEKVNDPTDIVKPGDNVDVKILRVDMEDRKIGLSLKRAKWGDAEVESGGGKGKAQEEARTDTPTRGGMDDHGALGTDKIEL